MFASRSRKEVVFRVLLILAILFNAFAPTAVQASAISSVTSSSHTWLDFVFSLFKRNSAPQSSPVYQQSSNGALYLSLDTAGTIGGLSAEDVDILYFDGANWSMYFDASDVGIATSGHDVNDFQLVDADTLLLSFDDPITLGSLTVDPTDIIQFDATSLGENTSGTFSLYFDGIDVGLDDSVNEVIDALDVLSDGRVLISTKGSFTLPGFSGRDEDILAFTPSSLGDTTSGAWAMYFDGSNTGIELVQKQMRVLEK